jgi:hypothetical protein
MQSPEIRARFVARVCAAACVLLLAACAAPVPQTPQKYPQEITGLGESKRFPVNAAGYTRGRMIQYEPEMKNYSVGYNILEPALQNAVTLYFYASPNALDQQFEQEKTVILQTYNGSALVGTRSATFTKEGVTAHGRIAVFKLSSAFAQRQQELYSELIVIALPSRYFKVRSTAPADQAEAAASRMRALLDVVGWVE